MLGPHPSETFAFYFKFDSPPPLSFMNGDLMICFSTLLPCWLSLVLLFLFQEEISNMEK